MKVDSTPKIVLQNPYRMLGVYANAGKRDILANKGKAIAFLKVNKTVEYPLDMKGILPALNRTLDLINEADAHLAIVKEQVKYTQFWFLKMTPIDDVAFNHLEAGDMAQAKELWSKQESLSSLQNKLVCYLIEGKPGLALRTAEKLYGKFGDTYISKIDVNCTLQMSGTELLHQFIDSLGEEVGMLKLLGYELGAETKAYIISQMVGPLISQISSEVERAKKVDHKDPTARKNTGQKLMVSTKEPLQQLKGILAVEDQQYQMIADKLGLEILQCGIDYFNNSDDDDKHQTAMKIYKYAHTIVVGTLAKQRCEENVKILQKIIDELPPKEVIAEDKAIKAELAKFVRLPEKISYAITLLNNTKPHLQSIKRKLGATNEYYLKKSTQIVGNALHNVVEEVNEAQEPLARLREILGKMDPTMRSILLSGSNEIAQQFREIESKVKNTLREAWKATLLMDEFETENDFKSRYRENRNTLKSMCNQMGISTYVSRSSTSSSSTQSMPHDSSKNKPAKKEMNPIIAVVIIHIIWALFGLFSDGIEGFFVGLFAGLAGWIIPINYVGYLIIEWIYNKINE